MSHQGALVGRKVTFTPTGAGAAVIGARSKSISINNEAIDITSDDDSGWQTFLGTDPAQRGISMSISGILKDTALTDLALQDGSLLISEYTLDVLGLFEVSGDFHFGNMSIEAPYKEGVTFTAEVNSSGPLEYVADSTA
jgi:predicted secreted protein